MPAKLPVVAKSKSSYPDKALCPQCRKAKVFEPHSTAILSAGALLMNRKTQSGGMSDNLDGVMSLTWHGAHDGGVGRNREIYTSVYVADSVRGGQFDLYFCSTDCLRRFLNECVDALDAKVAKETLKMKRAKTTSRFQ